MGSSEETARKSISEDSTLRSQSMKETLGNNQSARGQQRLVLQHTEEVRPLLLQALHEQAHACYSLCVKKSICLSARAQQCRSRWSNTHLAH